MMTFLYVYVTDSSCADVCGSVGWRCSSSGTGEENVQPSEGGDDLPKVPDISASATHDAAAWKPTRGHVANDGEVVSGE